MSLIVQDGIGTVLSRMEGYDSTLLTWVASPPFSAGGGGAGSTTVTVSNFSTVVTVSNYSTIVTVSANPLMGAAPKTGQVKIAGTGTAVQLPSNVLTNGVILVAKASNAADLLIGGSGVTNTEDGTGNGYILAAGAATSAGVDNTNRIYVNGTAGDILSFIGS